ncbi:MAG: NAD(P)-binding domain-containing protein [Promethearchaeota archaeon]|nr:MAG: NAD(P)-binding domain-containing protein [Candidatus Lokiarchaeota archaeon]
MNNKITTISVIGAGYMGRQIIEKSALYGYNINVYDVSSEGLEEFISDVKKKTDEDKIKIDINVFPSISEAVRNTDLVIEAVPEKLELKKEIFSLIDKSAPKNAIIATNSSSIPISKLEDVVERKDKLLNIHFYNLFTMPLADIMKGTQTSEETFQKGKAWVESIEIVPLEVKKECYGFVLNRIWRAIKKDCLKIWAGGYADIETVDKAWPIFCQYFITNEYGPFQFMDRIGLDVIYDIEMSYFKNSGLPDDKPPDTLKEIVDRGELGVKTEKGFYNYKTK